MSSQTFSRTFLQGIPEQRKQDYIERFIAQFIGNLQEKAAAGETSYLVDISILNPGQQIAQAKQAALYGLLQKTPPILTNNDLVITFQRKFPDCDVSYQEIWIDMSPTNRVLKKGIVIDWTPL